MKKLVALLLGGAMCATAIAGIAGCKPKTPAAEGREDPRAADAYTAYDYEGNVVGGYKTIADAITAVVHADLDFMEDEATEEGAEGGYVTRKDGSRHLFTNKKGVGDGTDDQYWYYQDGNKLAGYSGWDGDAAIDHLRNQKVTVNKVSDMGLTSLQSWNGFGLLNEVGQEDTTSNTPASWALSTAMDAGVIAFPSSMGGIKGTGMTRNTYDLDLSEVKITPPYEGSEDPVYAFIGFYLWHSQYVLAVGVGCDTSTGKWYEFRGTSREDDFSKLEYDVGNCLMESTRSKDGYFTPNASDMQMTVETVKHYDEEFDENYYSIKFNITLDGEEALAREYDDDYLHIYSSWDGIDANNDYMFIAGLDVKNKVVSGAKVGNVDYFNGAKFEDLCVTDAKIYFPTEEEFDNVDLGFELKEELRGTEQDFLLANSETSSGTYAYTILSNYACTSYEGRDGVDYYSFYFDGDPVGETEIGGQLKEYQDEIDSLSAMTVDNVQDYLETYEEVTGWYGKDKDHAESTLKPIHLNLLDFTAYEAARETYFAAMNVSEEGTQVLDRLNKLNICTAASYPFIDWEAPEGAESISGYIWSEAKEFAEIRKLFLALDEDEQAKVIRLSTGGQDNYDAWEEFYDSVSEYLANETYTGKEYYIGNMEMTGSPSMMSGTEVLIKVIKVLYRNITNWFFTRPTNQASEPYVMNSDGDLNFKYNFHILYILEKMEEENVKIPEFVETLIGLATSTPRSENFLKDFREYLYPVLSLAGDIYARQQRGEYVWLDAEMAQIINDHMVGFKFREAGFAYNISSGDIRDRDTNYEQYFGLPNSDKNFAANLKYIMDIIRRDDPDAEDKIDANGYSLSAPVTPLANSPLENISPEAKAVREAFGGFSAMPKYEYKGWTAPQDAESVNGYLYSELQSFKEKVYSLWAELTEAQKGEVRKTVSESSFDAWLALAQETDILESYDAFTGVEVTTYANPKVSDTKKFTGMELFDQYVYWLYRIYSGGSFGAYNDSEQGTGTMDMDHSPFPSAYLCLLRDLLPANFEMPEFLQETWKVTQNPKYGDFYKTAYYPIYNTAKLAVRIHDDNLNAIAQLSKEELAFLNEVWVSTYTLGGHLSWNWISGEKFQKYMSARTLQIVKYAGGNLTKGDGTPYKTYEYIELVGKFLEDCGYTLDVTKNGWGVTDGTISAPVEEAPIQTAQDVIDEFKKLSNVVNMAAYEYKGWTTMGTDLKGYFSSELDRFGKILEAYNALGGDKSKVDAAVDAENWTAWNALATEIKTVIASCDGVSIKAATITTGYKADTHTTYTGEEALTELIAATLSLNETMNGDKNFNLSYRIVYLKLRFEEKNIKLPKFVTERIEQYTSALEEDIEYVDLILTLSKMIDDAGEDGLELSAEMIARVNELLVGKTAFKESTDNWGFTTSERWGDDPQYSEFTSRDKEYKIYYGFGAKPYLGDHLEKVMTYLSNTYQATATEHNMGITEAITAE